MFESFTVFYKKKLNEQKLLHNADYFDDNGKKISNDIVFNEFGEDNGLTIYYRDNVDTDAIKEFLKEFKKARLKIEKRFKKTLGSKYKDPDASYEIYFGKNIVFDNNDKQLCSAEYIRGYSDHSPNDSFYFNLPKIKSIYDDAIKDWIPDPNYKNNRSRSYNISKIEDIIIHEIGHAVYFQQPLKNRKKWKKYYDDGGWENATSLYGQESDTELFAETIVDIINDETHQITKDLIEIFNF